MTLDIFMQDNQGALDNLDRLESNEFLLHHSDIVIEHNQTILISRIARGAIATVSHKEDNARYLRQTTSALIHLHWSKLLNDKVHSHWQEIVIDQLNVLQGLLSYSRQQLSDAQNNYLKKPSRENSSLLAQEAKILRHVLVDCRHVISSGILLIKIKSKNKQALRYIQLLDFSEHCNTAYNMLITTLESINDYHSKRQNPQLAPVDLSSFMQTIDYRYQAAYQKKHDNDGFLKQWWGHLYNNPLPSSIRFAEICLIKNTDDMILKTTLLDDDDRMRADLLHLIRDRIVSEEAYGSSSLLVVLIDEVLADQGVVREEGWQPLDITHFCDENDLVLPVTLRNFYINQYTDRTTEEGNNSMCTIL